MEFWSVFGIIVFAIVGYRFFMQIGKSLPLLELMFFVAGLQWIIGPIIEYSNPSFHFKYYMYVPEETYMAFVAPAYGVFALCGLLFAKKNLNYIDSIDAIKNLKNYGIIIFIIGVFFDLISGQVPGSLGFFVFIISNFKYAGAVILFFSEDKKLRSVFYGALVYLFLSSLQKALFHDLVLWGVFFYMFWAIKNKPSRKTIILTFVIGAMSLTTLQTIKAAYRSQVWGGYGGNKFELFYSLLVDAIFLDGVYENPDDLDSNNIRLNQGWIISAIIDEVPKNVEFANGETINEAILASIFPRFLNPNKKKAGGQENFEKYTGLSLGENTSMGISIIGEAYVNYHAVGGIVFMGLWGLFLVKVWTWLLKLSRKNTMLIAFLPLIFLQVVKAETELVVVLNHLIKSMIVVFSFFWATKRFLNWNYTFGTAS